MERRCFAGRTKQQAALFRAALQLKPQRRLTCSREFMPTSRLPLLSEPAPLPDPLAAASASLIQPLATFIQRELQTAEWVCQPSADCMLARTLLPHPKTSEQQLGKGGCTARCTHEAGIF